MGMVVIELKDHQGRGDIRIMKFADKLILEIEMNDVGGSFWETAGEFDNTPDGMAKAMSTLGEIIMINAESDFYE